MKTTDNHSQNQLLENLFREIPLETPSAKFAEKLTFRIEKEIQKQKRKRKWITIAQVAAGVIGILCVPTIFLYRQKKFAFSFPSIDISFDPLVWIIGLAILVVLISDSLVRKYIHS